MVIGISIIRDLESWPLNHDGAWGRCFLDLLNVLSVIYHIVHPAILIIGLWFCWKISFKPGFWFFLILLIQKLYGTILSWYMNSSSDIRSPFEGLSLGEWLALHSLAQAFLHVLAYLVLVVGLYKLWKRNPHIWKA